jgi:hypothetical protein
LAGWTAKHIAAAFIAAGLATLAPRATALAQDRSMEYAVKAAYLSKFAPFVEWPASAFASPGRPFQLCVLGKDPFDGRLDAAARGQVVDGHPVQVRRLQHVDAASGCHILFLGGSLGQSADAGLKAVRGAPTLTVVDDGGAEGAIIRFVVKGDRVRFEIDASAAAANRLSLSSKLLSLALAVHGRA